jgi:alpha 1,3-glucosidase
LEFAPGVSVEVRHSPFLIVVYQNSSDVVRINSDGLLAFEAGGVAAPERHEQFTDSVPNGRTSVGADFSFRGDETRISGLPERASSLNLGDTDERLIRLFNTDAYEYEAEDATQLYGSVPLVVAHSPALTAGLFWMNPSDTFVNISTAAKRRSLRLVSEGGYVDFVLYLGNVYEILEQYTRLAGRPAMPHAAALGYHQSKWGYQSQHEVELVARGLSDKQIPFDALWLDIDHHADKTPFTFDRARFASPENLFAKLAEEHRILVRLADPHLPQSGATHQARDARKHRLLVAGPSGQTYVGDAWPGLCYFVDFLNPAARQWWGQQFVYGNDVTAPNVFAWNDMNEPSVFKGFESTFPKDAVHHGGLENREVKNAYGALNAAATYAGLLSRNPAKDVRPFVLTRSFFAGAQRYAFTWSGDNTASWEHLSVSLPMVLTIGLCGAPFSGADVGGFMGSADSNLLARWFQAGAWGYPFFREHCHHRAARREPSLFDGEDGAAIRAAVAQRYRMLPLWYTLAYHSHTKGRPIVRPVFAEFGGDLSFHDIDREFLLGDALLVAPIVEDDQEEAELERVPGRWYALSDGRPLRWVAFEVTIADVPVYLRAGKIVPTFTREGESVHATFQGNLTLYVAVDDAGRADGEVYLDEGTNYEFLNGEFVHRRFRVDGGKLRSTAEQPSKKIPELFRNTVIDRIIVYGGKKPQRNLHGVITVFHDDVLTLSGLSLKLAQDWTQTLY